MNQRTFTNIIVSSTILCISCFAFTWIYGFSILNPTNTEIQAVGDIYQHYYGWLAFRNESWHFPIGMFNTLTYPNPVSIIYTDSIPLAAIFFKLLSPILPSDFQYFGLWGMLCFILQAYFSAKIIRIFCDNKYMIVCGTLFFVTSPILLYRLYGHESLAAQWILLAALYEIIRAYKEPSRKFLSECIIWALLGILTVSIHLYFLPMVGLILCSFVLYTVLSSRELKTILLIVIYIVFAIITIALLGGFSHYGATYDAKGICLFSFNLNGFVNPINANISGEQTTFETSQIFPALQQGLWQYEGFSYLGAGMILLSLISFGVIVIKYRKKENIVISQVTKYFILAIFILCITSTVLACSPVIQFGNICILDYQSLIPQKIMNFWGIFRSTGRFIWIPFYVLYIGNLYFFVRISRTNTLKNVFIVLIFALQIFDLNQYLAHKTDFNQEKSLVSFNNNSIREIVQTGKYKHLVFDSNIKFTDRDYYSFAKFALDNNLTLNYFWLVHNTNTIEPIQEIKKDCIYIFDSEYILLESQTLLQYYTCGKYIFAICRNH